MPTLTRTANKVTLDESSGLQNLAATPGAVEDANDNDIALASLNGVFAARLSALSAPATAIGAALSGYTGATGNTGADAFTIGGGGTVSDVKFTDINGAALNGIDSGLKTVAAGGAGDAILLYTDSVNNNVLLGKTAAGALVFAAYIEETATGGKIWTVQYQALFNPVTTNPDDPVNLLDRVYVTATQTQDAAFDLAGAPSGQNLFLTFSTMGATAGSDGRISGVSIVATGKDPANQSTGANITTGDTLNTSQAGGPTTFGTNSQMITEQEGIRFTFVTGARQNVTIPNLDQNEADVEANIDYTGLFGARTAQFDVVQLQSGKSAQVKVTTISMSTAGHAARCRRHET